MRRKPSGFMDATVQGFTDRFYPISGFMGGSESDLPGFDGTSTIYRPSSATHWTALSLPVPAYRFPLQEASGSVTDEVRGATMAASGAVTYQASGTETSYASKGVQFPDGTAALGFTATTGNLWNVTRQAIAVYIEIEVVSVPAALRSVMAFTGASSFYLGLVQATAGKANLSCRSAATTNGTYDYNDGKRHPVLITLIPSASSVDHAGGGLYRVSTDKQQITGTWSFASNSTKGPGTGGSASLTSAPVKMFDFAGWVGTDAETMALTTTEKVALQRRGWTVTGY